MKKPLLLAFALAATAIPKTAVAEGPALYAYQAGVFGSNPFGLYKMGINGEDCALLWKDPLTPEAGRNMLSGWIRDGKLCGIIGMFDGFSLGDAENNFYVERDLLTGEVSLQKPISVTANDYTNFFVTAEYCPYDNFIYGVGKNAGTSGYAFKKCPADNIDESVIINTSYGLQTGFCFNEDWGMFVSVIMNKVTDGVYTAELDEIDINTGERKKLFDLDPGFALDYNGIFALKWIPSRRKYYWNAWNAWQPVGENVSKLIEIDPFTGECTTLTDFPTEFNINYFLVSGDKPYADPSAPSAPAGVGTDAQNGSATLTFTLPTVLNDGTAIEGELGYSVYRGYDRILSGSGAAGSEITTEAIPLADGTYFFRVQAEKGDVPGSPAVATVIMGKDVPSSPANVTLTESLLTWDAVTTGQHGTPLSDVTYQVSVNGATVGNTAETSFDVSPYIDRDREQTAYTAQVRAVADNVYSVASKSNMIIAGRPWQIPFEAVPDETVFDLCTTQDVDGDGTNWSLYERSYDDEPVFLSGFNKKNKSEDWLFLPAFTGSGTSINSVKFEASLAQEDLVNGELQVWVGASPAKEAMKKCLIPATKISHYDPVTYHADFVIDGELAGSPALYIGLAVSSQENENSPVMIGKISVSEAASDLNRPAAVTDLKAVASDKSSEIATVSFKMPETLLDGTAIPSATAMKARVEVMGMGHVEVTGAPGESVRTDIPGYSGYNVVAVTPMIGDERGLGSNVSCHLGFGRPGPVRNLRVSYPEDDLGLRIDWDAPDVDYYGKPASGGTFSYKVWQMNDKNQYELAVEVPVGLSYADVTMSEKLDLVNMQIAVTAVNNEGEGPFSSIMAQLGQPYTLPLEEDFNGETFTYEPFTVFNAMEYAGVEYKWGSPARLGLPEKYHAEDVGDVICAWPMPETTGVISKFWIPKFSTKGYSDANLELTVWTGADAPETTVTGWAYGMEAPVAIGTLPRDGDGYNLVTIPLPKEMCDNSWVQISIESSYPGADSRLLWVSYAVKGESGVEGVADTLLGTVCGGKGEVRLVGFAGETADVYTADGRKVATVKVSADSCSLPLPAGLYVVKAGRQTAKVAVR